jgi:phosphohistidine swiveling domain-containing protein
MGVFKSRNIFMWGPNDGAPLTVHYSAFAGYVEIKKDLGLCWPKGVMAFKKDKMTWFNDFDELWDRGKEFVSKLILDKKNKKKTLALWKRRIAELEKVHKEIDKTNISKLSDDKLMNLFNKFTKAYFGMWSPGMIAEPVNFGAEKMMREELEKVFSEKEINDFLIVLCATTKLSFYAGEEISLLKIAKQMKKHRKEILEGRYDFKDNKRLQQHSKKYFWMLNNYYETRYLDEYYFGGIIKKSFEENINLDKRIKEIEDHVKESRKKKKELIKKHKLSRYIALLSDIVDEFMLFQDERKKYNLMGMHYLDVIIAEIGRRHGIGVQDMKYLFPEEIEKFSKKADELKRIIKDRKELCVVVYDNNSYKILDRKPAQEHYEWLFRVDIKDSDEINGVIASKGHAKGRVCLMFSVREVSRMKKGDVLVTTMTSPEFVVAMKKASAIVTDQGGLTSHAAIVSRELKIPCVIGTKIATKIFKDGDIIEVDANKGIVKKVK